MGCISDCPYFLPSKNSSSKWEDKSTCHYILHHKR
jgi:hypothetical protein